MSLSGSTFTDCPPGLLSRLEAAGEGSLELDESLGEFAGIPRDRYVPNLGDLEHRHYTTSLDAKLPWENIVEVRYRDGKWSAAHKTPEGLIHFGDAKTEVLARRIAALRARA